MSKAKHTPGQMVRKLHPYDGTPWGGKPIGPHLKVIRICPHRPVDGPGAGLIVELSDGTWEFEWNLEWPK